MNYDSKEEKNRKEKAPTMLIELVDQRDSGFVLDGTRGTKNEDRVSYPSARFISNKGFRLVKGVNPDTGKEEYYNEPIRYIKNRREISLAEQERKNIRPAKNKQEDLIIIKKATFSVTREGAYIGLYDYLKQVFYNITNPDRPETAAGIFREVIAGKKEEEINESKMAAAEALSYIGSLYRRQGKEYVYDVAKIDTLCSLFLIYAETPSGKVNGLIAHAEKDPVDFLNKALKFEQTIGMEIGYALELGVIKFSGNTCVYANKDKVIADLGRGNLKHETKVNKLADLFGTPEYKAAYDEFKVELAAETEKQLK